MPLPGDNTTHDEAYAADARDLAKQLPDSFTSAGDLPTTPTVLLTGATGFLGSYILRELLDGPLKARVIAHVRAQDPAAGLARIESTTKAYGLLSPSWTEESRLEVVVGDISKAQLGLTKDVWTRVVDEADAVIHNGAQVNWMLPYSSLRAANVLSTMACIEICANGKPKRLAFVSSTSTLDSEHYIELSKSGSAVQEVDDMEGSRKGLGTGYGQGKWASEYIVRESGRRGLVGAVIRPGCVTGDPESGISVTDDFLVRLWKGCLQVEARPEISNTVNTGPVTQVSRIVVASAFHLSTAIGQTLGVAQVTGRPRLTLNQWIGALAAYGYSVLAVSYHDWTEKIKSYVSDTSKEEHALLPLFHFAVGNLPADTIAPELDDSDAAASLKLYGGDAISQENPLAGNAMTVETVGMYLAYLVAVGFLPAPSSKGEHELPQLTEARLQALTINGLGGRSAKA